MIIESFIFLWVKNGYMQEILSIRLFALRVARLFPKIKIYLKPPVGLFGVVVVPRRLFLVKRHHQLIMVFTKGAYEGISDVIGCEQLGRECLLFESHAANESFPHNFEDFWDFMIKNEPGQHYLECLEKRLNRDDGEGSQTDFSPRGLFGEDLVRMVNRVCCHHVGKYFERPVDLLGDDDGDYWGQDLLDMISDICLLAPSTDFEQRQRILSPNLNTFGSDLVEFVDERSKEIFRDIKGRFNPNLLLQLLLSDDVPSSVYFGD